MNPMEYNRRVRTAMEERRQQDMQNRQMYQPRIHEQIQRLMKGYQAPLYARMAGLNSHRSLAMAESIAVAFASRHNRALADSETQALSEHFLTANNNNVLASFATTGFALFMTWKGRKSMKFPLFKPTFVDTMGPERSLKRAMSHGARLVAYYVLAAITVQPVLQAVVFWNRKIAVDNDPRLGRLLREEQGGSTSGEQDEQDNAPDDVPNTEAEYSSSVYEQQDTSSEYQSEPAKSQSGWANQRQTKQPSRGGWGNSSIGTDDASPVAQSQNGNANSNVSAWDQVRQRAQGSSRSPQQSSSQAQPQAPSWGQQKNSSGWGGESDEGSGERIKAQKDFDQLLDRERRGSDQGSNSWRR